MEDQPQDSRLVNHKVAKIIGNPAQELDGVHARSRLSFAFVLGLTTAGVTLAAQAAPGRAPHAAHARSAYARLR